VWCFKAVEVGLAPGACAVRWHAGRAVAYRSPTPAARDDWHAPLTALESWLCSPEVTRRRGRLALSVALSLEGTRFFRLPWSEALGDFEKAPLLAAAQFAAQFTASGGTNHDVGAARETHAYWVEDALPGEPRLVCAVDLALLTPLDELARRTGVRIVSVTPWLVTALNRHARQLPADGWFAVVEASQVGLVALAGGAAREIATAPWSKDARSVDSGWRVALARLECRMRLRSGRAEDLPLALLDASNVPVVSGGCDLSKLKLQRSAVQQQSGMSQSTDVVHEGSDSRADVLPDVPPVLPVTEPSR
jgi:hypothetical protein